MLGKSPYYYGGIKNCVIGFGALFSKIYIQRRKGDTVSGDILKTIQIPIQYAPKEIWLQRLDGDASQQDYIYKTFPLMTFEITGITYDSSRKLSSQQAIKCYKDDGTLESLLVGVPYNIDFDLRVASNNTEDNWQIIEQILPVFNPSYTLDLLLNRDFNLRVDTPILINGVSPEDNYTAKFSNRRLLVNTLSFTMKTTLLGPTITSGYIKDSTVILDSLADVSDSEIGSGLHSIYNAKVDDATGDVNETWTTSIGDF